MAAAFRRFSERNPRYSETSVVDALRAREYRRLDDLGQVYLDYTGASLYAESQVSVHLDMLRSGVYGNPHTSSPASFASTELAEQARRDILRHFHASP